MNPFRLLIVLLALCGASTAWADVTCLVAGNITLDSSDSYYCDTSNGTNCSGWREVDLDAQTQPLKYVGVEIWNTGYSFRYVRKFTNELGAFAALITMPGNAPCAGRQVRLAVDLRRVHEADLNAATPRFRFKITYNTPVFETVSRVYFSDIVTLDGPTSVENWHFDRVQNAPETEMSAAVNLYHMTNSALTEAVKWGAVIDQAFSSTNEAAGGIFRVLHSSSGTLVEYCGTPGDQAGGCFRAPTWYVAAINVAGNGMLMRHEVGHAIHSAIHGKVSWSSCSGSPNYGGSGSRDHRGCEWGPYITREMFVNVLAYRTIVDEDQTTDVWRCGSTTLARVYASPPRLQDLCVGCRTVGSADADRISNCLGDGDLFVGIGDLYATSPSHCTLLERIRGCGACIDTTPADGICDDYQSAASLAWRNPVNFERFMWDLLDSSNESFLGVADNSNLAISDLVATMSTTMGFGGNVPAGQDGTYREPSPVLGGDCVPEYGNDPPTGSGVGTRDGYNVRDFEEAVTGSQVGLMTINCVSGAVD